MGRPTGTVGGSDSGGGDTGFPIPGLPYSDNVYSAARWFVSLTCRADAVPLD